MMEEEFPGMLDRFDALPGPDEDEAEDFELSE
jgi:hypothetical protein